MRKFNFFQRYVFFVANFENKFKGIGSCYPSQSWCRADETKEQILRNSNFFQRYVFLLQILKIKWKGLVVTPYPSQSWCWANETNKQRSTFLEFFFFQRYLFFAANFKINLEGIVVTPLNHGAGLTKQMYSKFWETSTFFNNINFLLQILKINLKGIVVTPLYTGLPHIWDIFFPEHFKNNSRTFQEHIKSIMKTKFSIWIFFFFASNLDNYFLFNIYFV